MVAGNAKKHCLVMSSLEHTIARLRSRIRHIKDGDTNTALFHREAGFRKKKNFIPRLMVEDHLVTAQEDKEEAFFSYFNEVLGMALPRTSSLNLGYFHHAAIDLSALDDPITEEEVWQTIE